MYKEKLWFLLGTFLYFCWNTYFVHGLFSWPQYLEVFMTIAYKSSSDKILVSVSLRSFPRALHCSFVWNIFLFFFPPFCLTFCVGFCVLDKKATSITLEGVASWRWWSLSLDLAYLFLVSQTLMKAQMTFFSSQWFSGEEGAETAQWTKAESLRQNLGLGWLEATSSRSLSLFSVCSSLILTLSLHCRWILQFQTFCWVLLMISTSLLNFSFCSFTTFLILLTYLLFSCNLLNFLK